ncbi:hypothetical protein I6H88_19930 [Elizabethkingia bruuniana]|uniref:Lipoprotein n=1 Tax=Elizabethkingia bruuniana TaxID=1756149 RepID=A0A7T7UZ02_9FLAO|nr:hypothetical protein [Elizabethkingia bruuniana]KGO09504.1 hypothetical protein KS04_13535 [Elizabethkingia miricola]QDZ62440.1 hypothetical protein EVD20_05975 [Elizabethkingia bruuniana]QQN58664.1 hypothetical protein I6H88_19930 [Elizabethkingia bruuniana]
MKKILFILFTLMFLLSCNNKIKENIQEDPVPILIAVGYYPTFHQSIETIIDLKGKYILFYSPNSFLPEPPPPPSKNKEHYQEEKNKHQQYLAMHPKPIPFKTSIEEKDMQKIKEILNSFQKEDFEDKDMLTIDGMFINIVIAYSNDEIKQIRPLNNPTLKQEELYKEILNLLMSKNTNENNSIIIQNLIR